MNSVFVLIIGFIVFFIGYKFYAKRIDTNIIKADAKRATPAKMYMDGVEFMPTSKTSFLATNLNPSQAQRQLSDPLLLSSGDGFPPSPGF